MEYCIEDLLSYIVFSLTFVRSSAPSPVPVGAQIDRIDRLESDFDPDWVVVEDRPLMYTVYGNEETNSYSRKSENYKR